MSEAAENLVLVTTRAQKVEQKSLWSRQEGESMLWYNRFLLYRDCGSYGAKRSVRAALAKERETLRLVDQPQKAQESAHVPGSWKQAARQWSWRERAEAYDSWRVDTLAELMLQRLQEGYANKTARVETLDSLARAVIDRLDKSLTRGLRNDEYLIFVRQIQSIFRDLALETRDLDESLARALLRPRAAETLRNAK